MPDPIARKRLKKKMLDRWENEGGALAAETTAADDRCGTTKGKRQQKKATSLRDSSRVDATASSIKTPKPKRK